jgi:hypothetical protein
MDELKILLEQNPKLKAYQSMLEKEMDSVPEEHRLTVLAKHIAWNLEELETELIMLKLKLIELGGIYESDN